MVPTSRVCLIHFWAQIDDKPPIKEKVLIKRNAFYAATSTVLSTRYSLDYTIKSKFFFKSVTPNNY